MYVKSLYLKQFRNYQEAFFEFTPTLNLICGPNAVGKTSVLEAIHYLMLGRSFRAGLQQDLILNGCISFYIEAIFCKHGVDQKLRFYFGNQERKIIHNSTELSNISNLIGLIQGVIITPDNVSLVKGAPPMRRQFLDIQLAQADPLYVHYLSRYSKAIKQRNQLLKIKKLQTIENWENEMAKASAYITLQRRQTVAALQIFCAKFYRYLAGNEKALSLEYQTGASDCQNLAEIQQFYLELFCKNRPREAALGYTLSGPHKDDIRIGIDGKDVRFFASEGEQRTCVAALHMGEWQRLKETTKDAPLFMIDDVGVSLDSQRRGNLLDRLANLGQVFLTSTDAELAATFGGQKKILHSLYPFTMNSSRVLEP